MTGAMLKLVRSGSKRACFNPDHLSMTTGHSSGDVDGLVALEIGRKDDVEEAQLVVVVILGHADRWPERADNNNNALSFLSWPAGC